MPHSIRLGIIGLDDFSEKLLNGIIQNNVVIQKNIYIASKDSKKLENFQDKDIMICQDDYSTLIKSEIIIISVPKREFGTVLAPICAMTRGKIIISTVEGIDCNYIKERVTGGTYTVYAPHDDEDKTQLIYSDGFPNYLKEACEDIFNCIDTVNK